MGCNCGKKKLSTQPKKIVKSPRMSTSSGNGSVGKRIIRRAMR
jgi:hypothetical protein